MFYSVSMYYLGTKTIFLDPSMEVFPSELLTLFYGLNPKI